MNEQWGVGDRAHEPAFETVEVEGKPVELIFGQHPHSRRDNNIYARFPDGRIEGFDGHRVLVDVQVRSENYLKDSSLSGAEVRAWVQVEISFNRKKVYRFGRRSAERALFDAQWAIDRLFNLPVHVWREEELERWLGRVIAYHGRPMAVHGWDLDQGRVVLATQPSDGREPVVVGVDLLDGGIRWFGDC